MATAKTKAAPPPFKTGQLSALELTALAIEGKPAAKLRDNLCPGTQQPVDFTVRIHGTVNIGDKQTQPLCEKPEAVAVLALCLAGMDQHTRDRTVAALVRAHESFRDSGEPPHVPEAIEKQTAELLSACAHRGTRTVRGNVTADLAHEIIARPRRRRATA